MVDGTNMILLTLMLAFSNGFKSFAKSGHENVCLVNYQTKTVKCDYNSMTECREQYMKIKGSLCFLRKNLHIKGDLK